MAPVLDLLHTGQLEQAAICSSTKEQCIGAWGGRKRCHMCEEHEGRV